MIKELQELDRRLTRRTADRIPPAAGGLLSALEASAQHSKLWCGTALLLATAQGRRGRKAAAAGMAALAVAQLLSNAVCKQLADRPRPPRHWFAHDKVNDRPDSSSFPSGHTAAAVAFTAAIAPVAPLAGAVCTLPAGLVAVERVHSGAHYPSDVLAGAVIGVISAGLVHGAARAVRGRLELLMHLGRVSGVRGRLV
ncbi:phosphatase PAP2 family protein [Streptomyces sp. PA5.6]|uniref:phosphatase PAP2 family protein n=1 Tax=Streptomyces sp. PA5.6 TaxID=3035651 RepID=UPI003904A83E